MSLDLTKARFKEITSALEKKQISAVEITKDFFSRIEKLDSQLNSFITKDLSAFEQAQKIDQKISRGEALASLEGVPFGIKDMLCTKGVKTTAASKILENFIPPYDATVVARLKKAGALILGKLNQDEFAMGSSNETSFFGPTKNPWNTDCTPGGSSGGSAAAQAARLVAGSIGTDTGGSIRQPASFCGVVGVKPTYGRVSRYGIIAYASSLDQAGPLSSCVDDAALTLEVICGHDPNDATTSQRKVPLFSKELTQNIRGLKIGVMKEYNTSSLDSDVAQSLEAAIEVLKKAGCEIVEVSVPMTEHAVPVYYLIASSEASSNLARYDGIKYGHRSEVAKKSSLEELYSATRGEGFGSEVKRRIMLGTYCLSSGYYDAYYNKACQVRGLLTSQMLEQFKKCDVIISPVTTSPAFKIGERISDPLTMYLNDIFTVSTNLAGLPGMSVPFGLSKQGLPIGIQIQAQHFDEQRMLNVGLVLEEASLVKGRLPHVI